VFRAYSDEIDLSHQFIFETESEIIIREFLQLTECRPARGADQCVESTDIFEQFLDGSFRCDVDAQIAADCADKGGMEIGKDSHSLREIHFRKLRERKRLADRCDTEVQIESLPRMAAM
jgi:hypothetical protein